jgi:hypothetical protein
MPDAAGGEMKPFTTPKKRQSALEYLKRDTVKPKSFALIQLVRRLCTECLRAFACLDGDPRICLRCTKDAEVRERLNQFQ